MRDIMRVKLRRDLRTNWVRVVLMVVATAISLAIFGGVLNAWLAIGRETPRAYASSEPASATILLERDINEAAMNSLVDRVQQQPGVIRATGRAQFTSEVSVNGQPRIVPLQTFVAAPDDPMRMVRFDLKNRPWPPKPDEIYLLEDTLELLDAAVGDTVDLTSPTGKQLTVRVAGTVYDPSLSPSAQEQSGRAFLSSNALGDAQAAVFDQLKVQVADPGSTLPSRDRDRIVEAASSIAQSIDNDRGIKVREIQVPTPYAHPHQWIADSLLLTLLTGGAIAFVLSTILVGNMLGNLFTEQIPQIGILKAIGARSRRVARQYLTLTLLVASAATLIGFMPALLIGRLGVSAFSGFLGLQPESLAAPWWSYATIVLVGLLLPPAMAMIPLLKASRITVRQALDHRGTSTGRVTRSGLLARLGRIPTLNRGVLMAIRNTIRRPLRFTLAAGLLAAAGTVFVAGISLSSSVSAVDDQQNQRRSWDVDVSLTNPTPTDRLSRIADETDGVERTEAWTRLPASVAQAADVPVTRTYPDQGHGSTSVTAVPDGSQLIGDVDLIDGRWLTPGETDAVVVDQIVRNVSLPDVKVGDRVDVLLNGKRVSWTVVGMIQQYGTSGGMFVTAEALAKALGGEPKANQLRIVTSDHSESARGRTAAAVETQLTDAGITVQAAASISRAEQISAGHLAPLILMIVVISVAMALIGLIGLGSTMTSNTLDRIGEFGVMHAVGARPRTVRRIVILEGVILALLSCIVAILPTLGLASVLGTRLGTLFMNAPLPYRISLTAGGLWAVLCIIGAIAATDVAAARASRVTVREAMAKLT